MAARVRFFVPVCMLHATGLLREPSELSRRSDRRSNNGGNKEVCYSEKGYEESGG